MPHSENRLHRRCNHLPGRHPNNVPGRSDGVRRQRHKLPRSAHRVRAGAGHSNRMPRAGHGLPARANGLPRCKDAMPAGSDAVRNGHNGYPVPRRLLESHGMPCDRHAVRRPAHALPRGAYRLLFLRCDHLPRRYQHADGLPVRADALPACAHDMPQAAYRLLAG